MDNSIVLYIIQSYLIICGAIGVGVLIYKACGVFETEEDKEW